MNFVFPDKKYVLMSMYNEHPYYYTEYTMIAAESFTLPMPTPKFHAVVDIKDSTIYYDLNKAKQMAKTLSKDHDIFPWHSSTVKILSIDFVHDCPIISSTIGIVHNGRFRKFQTKNSNIINSVDTTDICRSCGGNEVNGHCGCR